MLIKDEFEVAEPVEKVWQFFENIPQVAACLPGAELTEDLGDDTYKGKVAVRMGLVRLQFVGTADITERDEAAKRVVVHASGADEKGRGQASMVITATLGRTGRGTTKVGVVQDLQLSGAAARYGRGMITDVTAVLMRDFAANMQGRSTYPHPPCRFRAAGSRPGRSDARRRPVLCSRGTCTVRTRRRRCRPFRTRAPRGGLQPPFLVATATAWETPGGSPAPCSAGERPSGCLWRAISGWTASPAWARVRHLPVLALRGYRQRAAARPRQVARTATVLSPLPVTQMVLACGSAATSSGSLRACTVATTVSVR